MRRSVLTFSAALLCSMMIGCSTDEPASPTSVEAQGVDESGSIAAITITTSAPAYLTSLSATVGGTAATDGAKIVERGVCYATVAKPTIANTVVTNGSGPGTYECVLGDLAPNTKYYAKAYCKNAKGRVFYGAQVTFTTLMDHGTVTDIDGNVYTTVTIGNQVWTQQNLRTTRYRDGSLIPNVLSGVDWSDQVAGAYCAYNNDATLVPTYGLLYNWFAVDDPRGLTPAGWHVASYEEWRALGDYLGRHDVAGGRMKETGLTHWNAPNTGATNAARFYALPNGSRIFVTTPGVDSSAFNNLGNYGPCWTSTASTSNPLSASFIECFYNSTSMLRTFFFSGAGWYDKRTGYAVRLVKDVQ